MGQGLSTQSAPLAQKSFTWLLNYGDSAVKYASGASLEVMQRPEGVKLLALAYQASDVPLACSHSQNLRFQFSKDAGESWTAPQVVQWGLTPLWSPALFFDKDSGKLFLFYSESRKSMSPGGDIKYVVSSDVGATPTPTWSEPATIYTHEADDEVPKVTSNRPIVKDGVWYLPIHTEPCGSHKVFNAKTFTPLQALPAEASNSSPPTARRQSLTTTAAVLMSHDQGASWAVSSPIEDQNTWLIDPAIESIDGKGGNRLVMYFRTAVGKVFTSQSVDRGATWSRPMPTSLPNPNAKVATVTIDGQILMAFNDSATDRNPLTLGLSVDGGKTWERLVVIEREPGAVYSSPSIVEWSEDTVKVAYSVWGEGLRLATLKLATVEN